MAKAKKTRAKKYDEKLAIQGSFEDVIKVSVAGAVKKETPKKINRKGGK